jgi:hypothetical protein
MTHFINCIENPNVPNSSCNRKKTSNTSDARPIMCISSANEGKTQIRWVIVIRQRVRRWANNTPPKNSFYHVLGSNEIIMKSSCLEASEKYNGDGCA